MRPTSARLKSEFVAGHLAAAAEERQRRTAAAAGRERRFPSSEFLEVQTEADEAGIAVHRAQQALVNLGLPVEADEIAELEHRRNREADPVLGLAGRMSFRRSARRPTSNLLPLRSPLDGRRSSIATRSRAKSWTATSPLFDVADTSRLWLNAQRAAGRCAVRYAGPDGAVSARATA